jgi:ATP-binding cassette, subfamily A (ABC1), member 3
VSSPWPRTQAQLSINGTVSGFFAALIFSMALGFKFASVISFIVKERNDKAKHQQIVSGMNISAYWIGNYVYDLLLYWVIAGISLGLIQALQVKSLT